MSSLSAVGNGRSRSIRARRSRNNNGATCGNRAAQNRGESRVSFSYSLATGARGNGLLSCSIEERTKARSRKRRSHSWNELILEEEIPHLYPLLFWQRERQKHLSRTLTTHSHGFAGFVENHVCFIPIGR